MSMKQYEFWFVVGSQFLYGPEVLDTVAARAAEMTDALNASGNLPCRLVYKVTAKTNKEISDVVRDANHDPACAGLVTWCHTFSPSKMWIDLNRTGDNKPGGFRAADVKHCRNQSIQAKRRERYRALCRRRLRTKRDRSRRLPTRIS